MRMVSRGMAIIIAALSLAGRASAAPVETVLYSFTGGSDGRSPLAGLIADNSGALYGTTEIGGSGCPQNGCGIVFKLTPPAKGQTTWTETVLYRFTGGSDGAYPFAGLIADNSGALYGTTEQGGSGCLVSQGDYTPYGCGTVFKLTPPAKGQTTWTETVLYRFTGGSDGALPGNGSLIADKQGALYGTTAGGGSNFGIGGVAYGTVFKLTPPAKGQTTWTETVLYRFCLQPGCSDSGPEGGLIANKQGALYGTTTGGGSGNDGTVFELTPPAKGQTTWTETVLYRFTGGSHGSQGPGAGLIADNSGALYGTTPQGGGCPLDYGCGTVFKLTPPAKGQTTWTETVLYPFTGGDPGAGLIADNSGALYGTTEFGGSGCPQSALGGCGSVFKLRPPAKGQTTWTETVLYSFKGGSDGANPFAGLMAGNSGALYGTTGAGGTASLGTVFKLDLCPEPRRSDDHDRCPVFLSEE